MSKPMLVLLQDGKATPFPFDGDETVIGRHPDCQVQLESNMVSRRHARVFSDVGKLFVEDLGSGNGTFLNGSRVESPMRLRNGDRLKVGPVLFRFEEETASLTPRGTARATTTFRETATPNMIATKARS